MTIKIGFITISDRASHGQYQDLSGPAMADWVQNAVLSKFKTEMVIIPDEQSVIEKTMLDMVNSDCNLILTSGGTEPTARDVTPEATKNVCTRIYDGFAELIYQATFSQTKSYTAPNHLPAIHLLE